IYTPKGRAGEVGFAARETPAILKALESYFGIDYPYRKLDFLAVPEFAFGAMENPGLVTYRTDYLMVGDTPTGIEAATVLSVIAHELAHQWYGNLVTMRWWDDLWLNESFASWMGEKVMESLYPQYETNLGLPQSYAFPTDELSSAKPVRRPVRSEDEAFEDLGLAYSKGETILRMLESYAGPEAFQAAIRDYITRFSRSNATEHDLWSVVAEHADADIGAIAARYLNQPGFPLVTVDAKGNVSQSRYHRLGRELPAQQWLIPLNVKYKHDGVIKQTFTLLDKPTGTLDIPADAQWVLPDADATGYYRWNIDPAQFQRLVQDMSALSNRERIALLDNSEALLNAGELSLADYMMVLDKALADPHPLVLRPALNALSGIAEDFIDPSNAEAFSRFVDDALEGRLEQIGLEAQTGESETIAQLRPTLVVFQGRYGSDEALRKQVIGVADKYLADSDSVSSGLGAAALEIKARFGGRKEFEAYRKAYLGASSETMKSALLGSMYFSDPEVINESLDWFITDAVPAGDAIYGIYLASDVLEDNSLVFQWLEKNLDRLVAKSPPVRRPYFPAFTASCDQQAMERLVAFYEPRDEVYKPYLAKSVESIENCLARKQREGAALEQFLERYTK
ncbi:MAG: M1 family metallopeptidase, partial [Chromatiales bacterium]|nr:M1 family metallopeptidase [Chromatiales bacterium]